MPKLLPFLWMESRAELAAKFYTSLFPGAKITNVQKVGSMVMSVTMRLLGQTVILLNGGPHYELTPAFSFFVTVKTQKQLDALWAKLAKGGTVLRCGWLTDRYGVTWQILPADLPRLLGHKDP